MTDEKKKKGIGRGLISLFGDQPEEVALKSTVDNPYLVVSVSDLVPNQFQPRNYFDEKKIDELTQSVKKMV